MNVSDTVLGIFSVKKFVRFQGEYYTYGGFGASLERFAALHKKVVLFAHVMDGLPPLGHYVVDIRNLHIVELPLYSNELTKFIGLPKIARAAIKGFSSEIDIVQARVPDYTGIVGLLLARKKGVKRYCLVIANWHNEAKRMKWRRKWGLGFFVAIYMFLYDQIERYVTRGELVFTQGGELYKKYAENSAILVFSAAHSDRDLLPTSPPLLRNRTRSPDTQLRLITTGRLQKVKNIALQIKAISILNERGINARLTVIGEGPEEDSLRSSVRKYGLESQVDFVGQLSRSQLFNELDDAHIFILSSESEGTPKVLFEAMARNLPVIASDVGGVPSILGYERYGWSFMQGNVQELVERICLVSLCDDQVVSKVMDANIWSARNTVESACHGVALRAHKLFTTEV